jgi:sporulation protein YlmC with PRC-barrel domain
MSESETQVNPWMHRTVVDPSGSKVGTVTDVYVDNDTNRPDWLAVSTGLFGTKVSFVPIEGAQLDNEDVVVAYDKEMVKDAPDVSGDEIGEDTERQLYSYFGIAASQEQSDSVLPGQEGFTTQTPGVDRQPGTENVDDEQ